MPIELPQSTIEKATPASQPENENWLPREVVAYLDKFIIGQNAAKRAVAKALRDRIRRRKLPDDLRSEVMPKNIIMIGSTGVGKTEIARRLAKLTKSPFTKIEASKFTEVGYVGRDVESMIRDLVSKAIDDLREMEISAVHQKATQMAEERILDALADNAPSLSPTESDPEAMAARREARERLRMELREGKLEDRSIVIPQSARPLPSFEVIAGGSMDEMASNIRDMMSGVMSDRQNEKRMPVKEARKHFIRSEEDNLIDMDRLVENALEWVENDGIVFLDEIDKITSQGSKQGPDISREGVQRDLLPIIEGTSVHTKYGHVKTDHILFIAAGAFHISRPSDLIPELQGRFPIRVELDTLTRDDFIRILTEPENSLIRQYTAMMATEGIAIEFTEDAIDAIAGFAFQVNESTENIGARRLLTILEKLMDDISFQGPENPEKKISIDGGFVSEALADVVEDQKLSRYIL